MMSNLETGKKIIKDKIPMISNSPGVYRMLGEKKEILYIGKAKISQTDLKVTYLIVIYLLELKEC